MTSIGLKACCVCTASVSVGAIQSTLYATDRLPIGLSASAQAVLEKAEGESSSHLTTVAMGTVFLVAKKKKKVKWIFSQC